MGPKRSGNLWPSDDHGAVGAVLGDGRFDDHDRLGLHLRGIEDLGGDEDEKLAGLQ